MGVVNKQRLDIFFLAVALSAGCANKPEIAFLQTEKPVESIDLDNLHDNLETSMTLSDGSFSLDGDLSIFAGEDHYLGPVHELINNNFLSKRNLALDLWMSDNIYTDQEIMDALEEVGVPYQPVRVERLGNLVAVLKDSRKKLTDHLESKFPERRSEKERELSEEFEKACKEKRADYIDKFKSNKKVFLLFSGFLNPFLPNYTHLDKELELNEKKLRPHFDKRGYFVVSVKTKENFEELMRIAREHSQKDQAIVVFYQGHGTEDGLSTCSGNYQADELYSATDGLKGHTLLFVNSCFSGDVRSEFESRGSNVTVVSASKKGDVLDVTEFDKPGYLVQQLVGSSVKLHDGLDIDEFKDSFSDDSSARYHPKMYLPGKRKPVREPMTVPASHYKVQHKTR